MATYYDFISRCPADLPLPGTEGLPWQWYHAKPGCSGKMQVGDDARLRCVQCGEHFHLKVARYNCTAREIDFRATTSARFASAISTAGEVTGIAGKQWLIRLLENIGDDW